MLQAHYNNQCLLNQNLLFLQLHLLQDPYLCSWSMETALLRSLKTLSITAFLDVRFPQIKVASSF